MSDPRDRMSPMFSFGPRRKPEPAAPKPPPPPEPAETPSTEPAAEGGFRQWAGSGRATLAIAFSDIVSSSALGRKLGNRAMDELRRAHFRQARELVERHDGYVIKNIGDSIMAAFRAAADALNFALAVHAEPGDPRIQVRAGVHVGPVTVEGDDAFGTTVNYAARVVGAPKGAEVWLSSEARNHVDEDGAAEHAALHWQPHTGLELKGFPGRHVLWSVQRP